MNPRRKVLIVGSDGASPELIFDWAGRGILPTFQDMISRGARGRLESTIPPHSGPAWVSAVTGKNPGKHGVFYFTTVNPRHSPPRIVSSHDIRTQTLFDILSDHGKSSISLNIPITYPPWKIEGVLVSGMFAPSENVTFTYPPEVGANLVSMGYEVEFSTWDSWAEAASKRAMSREEERKELARRKSAYFSRAIEIDNKNTDALLYLLKQYDWDFSMVMLPGLDRIQHLLWQPSLTGEEHPAGTNYGCSRFIVEAYQNLDHLFKRILGAVGEETWVIMISDHGFGPTPKVFFINRWLRSKRYLKRANTKSGKAGAMYNRGILRSKSLVHRLRTGRPLRGPDMPAFHGLLPLSEIDLSQTSAYAPTPYGLLNVNSDSEHDRNRISEALSHELESLVDGETGSHVIRRAYKSSLLYPGPCQNEASDLVLDPNPDYYIENRVGGDEVIANASRHPASHKPEGVLLVSGPQIKGGFELPRAHIYDIAPTVLRLLGLPLSRSFDGRPLDEILQTDSLLLAERVQYAETGGKAEVSDRIKKLKSEGKL